MKIAIVTDAWHPQINGVVTTYVETIRVLRKLDHEVVTITPSQFKTLPCPTYSEIPLSIVRPSQIRNKLAKIAPHAVHIATEGPLGWAARRACIAVNFPFTTSYHTRFPEYVRMRFPIPLKLSYLIMRQFHNQAATMMVSTKRLQKEMTLKGFENVNIWSRGVDTDLFRPRPDLRYSSEQQILTYVGRVAPEKNIETFLNLNIPGKKVVIGDGPALESLRKRYPDVYFTGFKKGEQLTSLLASSTVFVFPSLTDTFGVVQLEALASGVPVAAFPVNGSKEIITNGINGWLDEDLATAVRKCKNIDSDTCRKSAISFSWESCTKQFVSNLCSSVKPYPEGEIFEKAA